MAKDKTYDLRTKRIKNYLLLAAEAVVGVSVNFMLFTLVSNLGLPLYLDNVGTVIASVVGGYIPGIIVGFATNIINCMTDPTSIYYGFISILIGVITGYFAKKGKVSFRKPGWLVLLILLLAFVGGGIGTFIPWLLDGVELESESFAAFIRDSGISNEAVAQFLGNYIMDVLDKAITVVIALIICCLIPKKLREKLRFSGWRQRAMSAGETESVRHIRCRAMSARTKIMLLLSTALVAMGAAATAISFILFSGATVDQHAKLVKGVTNVAAASLDPDSIDRWLAEGRSSEGYAETEKLLYNILNSDDEIEYIYVYKIKEDGCHVVFDLNSNGVQGSPVGDVIPFDSAFEQYIPTLLEGGEIEPVISDETFGYLLTVYTPVFDSSGNCVCYSAADVSMKYVEKYDRNFMMGMITLFLAFFIVIFALVLWVVEFHIVLPLNSMAMNTDAFAFNSDEALVNSVEKLRSLEIHTGDEVENLYNAIVKMSEDSVENLEDIRHKNETISKMQNALILVLADLVESRDKNTGDHVRKTAAYTRVIMRKMKEMGFYPDELTDKFMSDVGNSAPLHDVGKIKVSDVILNKPGRLNDDEFHIMQSHARIGGEIINQVIDLVPESDYLNEAINLASYHHEKWNGTGYPEGRKGEDIPLSARIMAVADVFDALVSRRSYKEPFSFEQAQNIIREGAGSHFDPKVAEAFLAAEDECRAIAESFGDLSDVFVEDNHVDDSGKLR